MTLDLHQGVGWTLHDWVCRFAVPAVQCLYPDVRARPALPLPLHIDWGLGTGDWGLGTDVSTWIQALSTQKRGL